jgi:hypothetical protein
VIDRTLETQRWAEVLGELGPQVRRTYTYFNNHGAGCGYQSAELFAEACGRGRPASPHASRGERGRGGL